MSRGLRLLVGGLALGLLAACTTPAPVPTPSVTTDPWSERGPITLARPTDESGWWDSAIQEWNQTHPDELVTTIELPADPTQQRARVAEKGQAKSGEYTVIAHESIWTAEFAAAGWLTELPEAEFPTDQLIDSLVATGTWDQTVYGYPVSSDVGMLYYRADLLAEAGVEVPTTWEGLAEACEAVLAKHAALSCFAAQYRGEDLTASMMEAIWAAGGTVFSGDQPTVNQAAAIAGIERLGHRVSRYLPEDAVRWGLDQTREAFAKGRLVFVRDWGSGYSALSSTSLGQLGSTGLLGEDGNSSAVLGGLNLSVSAFGRNRGTAAALIEFLTSEDQQRALVRTQSAGPARADLLDDKALVTSAPGFAALSDAVSKATARPHSDHYADISAGFQETGAAVLSGDRFPARAMADLQAKLEEIVK